MLGVTLTPTMAHASDKINVIPSQAYLKIDCRVPPGLGEDAARRRIADVLGDEADKLEIEFTEMVTGNASPIASPLMDAIDRWIKANDPGAETVPLILPGFSDSQVVPRGVPRVRRLRLLPPAPPDAARDRAADPQRQRAHRRPGSGVRRGLLHRPRPRPPGLAARVRTTFRAIVAQNVVRIEFQVNRGGCTPSRGRRLRGAGRTGSCRSSSCNERPANRPGGSGRRPSSRRSRRTSGSPDTGKPAG